MLDIATDTNAKKRSGAKCLQDLDGHETEGAVDVEEVANRHAELLFGIAATGDVERNGREHRVDDGPSQARGGTRFFYEADFRISLIVLSCISEDSCKFLWQAGQKVGVLGVHPSAFGGAKDFRKPGGVSGKSHAGEVGGDLLNVLGFHCGEDGADEEFKAIG